MLYIKYKERLIELNIFDDDITKQIKELVPYQAEIEKWGNEIYFPFQLDVSTKQSTMDLEIGDIAYWSPGQAFCIFWGSTPLSMDDKPKPVDYVVKFGKVADSFFDICSEFISGDIVELVTETN